MPGTAASSSTWTQYTYDSLGRVQTVTAKRLLSQNQNLTTTYAYDAVGDLASVLQPSGVLTSYSYDTLNRLLNLSATKGANVITNCFWT